MNTNCAATALLLACCAILNTDAQAQGRGPSVNEIRSRAPVDDSAARADMLAALEGWLRNLEGKFAVHVLSMQGAQTSCVFYDRPNGNCLEMRTVPVPLQGTFEGSGECESIGDGVGSVCDFEIVASSYHQEGLRFDPALPDAHRISFVPQRVLFGLDPDAPGIRLTWISGPAAWEASGSLSGNSAGIVCVSSSCRGITSIHATPDHSRIVATFVFKVLPPPPVIGPPPTTVTVELRRLPVSEDEPKDNVETPASGTARPRDP
jgi:hypothetical protein